MNTQVAAVSLFCLPCAGASATMYSRWQSMLPAWIRVVPVELPGRGRRFGEPFVEDFATLVAQLHDAISPGISGPFALFGHSMGAMLAHAVAQRLASPDSLLRHVFVSASPAPSRRERYCPPEQNDAALIANLRKQGGTPNAVFDNSELLRITLDTLGADYRVCASFRHSPGKTLSVPVCALAGRADEIDDTDVAAWREETQSAFQLHWFDGGHFFIREQELPVLQAVVMQLRRSCFAGSRCEGVACA